MRGRDADEPAPHVLRTNDIDAAGSVAAAAAHLPVNWRSIACAAAWAASTAPSCQPGSAVT